MKPIAEIQQIVNSYHEMGETIAAAEYLIAEYGIVHPNLKGFELRERAKPEYILFTAEGELGEKQIIRIPDNVFEFSLVLILNLIAHEMIHVGQKSYVDKFPDRNEREWQAYYEMVFHKPILKFQIRVFFTESFLPQKVWNITNEWEKTQRFRKNMLSKKKKLNSYWLRWPK